MCGIQSRVTLHGGETFFMGSKLHSFSGPKANNSFFFSQGGDGGGQAVHPPTTLNHLLHSLVTKRKPFEYLLLFSIYLNSKY